MLDRALKLIVTLTLLLFLLQSVIGVLCQVAEAALRGAVSAIGHAGSFLGSLLIAVAMASLFAGLVVRLIQFVATRNPHAARKRASRERAMRQRVRRPAEGVRPLVESVAVPFVGAGPASRGVCLHHDHRPPRPGGGCRRRQPCQPRADHHHGFLVAFSHADMTPPPRLL